VFVAMAIEICFLGGGQLILKIRTKLYEQRCSISRAGVFRQYILGKLFFRKYYQVN
jgi:hypothetical protein